MTSNTIGILASTKGTDMQAIIDAIAAKRLDAKIAVVVSDREHALALERAQKYHIPAFFVNPRDMDQKKKDREAFDREVASLLDKYQVKLILLIGYMRILSPWFVQYYQSRMMNIHPSLLPAFSGGMDVNVHEAVLRSGVTETGCTLHFVTETVDAGPIILQKKVPVVPGETVESLKQKVQEAEQACFLEAIPLFFAGKLDTSF
ncbi:phosphoribosylglycinamide formyltransferase [Candidatus Woesearchaeota archaeon]|nr:phosphoribosylglycinamide formyltransferase [Candidatus Woesearchaeota archaeon]